MKIFLLIMTIVGSLTVLSCRGYRNAKTGTGAAATDDVAVRLAKIPDDCKKINGTFQADSSTTLTFTQTRCGQIKKDFAESKTGATGSQVLIYDGTDVKSSSSGTQLSSVKRIQNKDGLEEDWTYIDNGAVTKSVKNQYTLNDKADMVITSCLTLPNTPEKCDAPVTLKHI